MIKCARFIFIGDEDDINNSVKCLEKMAVKIMIGNKNISIEMNGKAKVSKEWLDLRKRVKKYTEMYKKQLEAVESMKKKEGIK